MHCATEISLIIMGKLICISLHITKWNKPAANRRYYQISDQHVNVCNCLFNAVKVCTICNI